MQLEDQIKFEIRDGVRTLDQIRVQYPISVTQAALAAEQVISTQLQLELGVPEVRETDLLDALQRSRLALREVANSRISYLVRRAEFVLDLELMQLDERAFWPQINDPNYQPEPNGAYPWNAGSAYGTFPSYLKVSHEYRRMLNQPPPGASASDMQNDPEGDADAEPLAPDAPLR